MPILEALRTIRAIKIPAYLKTSPKRLQSAASNNILSPPCHEQPAPIQPLPAADPDPKNGPNKFPATETIPSPPLKQPKLQHKELIKLLNLRPQTVKLSPRPDSNGHYASDRYVRAMDGWDHACGRVL